MVVALTGGIGSGKSTVAGLFAARGVPVLDADHIARDLLAPGTPLARTVQERFGSEVMNEDGLLDRARLRQRVFSDPEQRRWLEALLHPAVYEQIDRHTADWPAYGYGVVCIPLLIETGQARRGYRVLVVDLPPELQLKRARERDGLDAGAIRAVMAAQATRAERLVHADDIIDNQGLHTALESQVEALHQRYAEMAANRIQSLAL